MNSLLSISPLDGRYYEKVKNLSNYFSEYALIKYRLLVELWWFVFLCNEAKLPGTRILNQKEIKILRAIYEDFDVMDAQRVKEIENTTNHDVKAIEYFIKEHLKPYPKIEKLSEFIHFGCTSDDTSNLAYSLIMRDFEKNEFLPIITGALEMIYHLALLYKKDPMMSRTHGQPATPTTMGKELINFVARLENLLEILKKIPIFGKINGAVGNFNAHYAAYPKINWIDLSKRFVESFGLTWNAYTTQIEPHDMMVIEFQVIAQLNTVLINFSRDIWMYISLGYFKQKIKEGEIGSSTMPHKVNPIDFENAEGNLGVGNSLFRHFAEKLPISRLQRDLSDSTVLRNIGSAYGYSILAYKSLLKGMQKLELNRDALKEDLDENFELLAEPIQTVLRKHKVKGAYEKLKELTRGKKITAKEMQNFIKKLKIPEVDKKHLMKLTPHSYIGAAVELVSAYKPKFLKT